MKISVFGTGYLGATHAACMAEIGHEVIGVDIDPAKIEALAGGEVPFFEPGLPDLLSKHVASGRLKFTSDYREALEFCNVHFVAVGTPQREGDFGADTTFVQQVVSDIAAGADSNTVIVGKSTVPVGTAEMLLKQAEAVSGRNVQVELIWNPEFLREGFAVQDTLHPDRIVIGVPTPDSRGEAVLREVYDPILSRPSACPLIVTDLATSELVKVSANAFLATKISFINAVSEVCEAANADVTVLANAIGLDDRIGRKFLGAGLGFGGGCLPKDIRAFISRAGELGAGQAVTFLREVDAINMRRREKMVALTSQVCDGSLMGKKVAVLGAAFKPNSDDVRDSPALSVAGMLSLKGARAVVYDPQAMDNAKGVFPTLGYADSAIAACSGADVVIVATEWPEFTRLDPSEVGAVVRRKVLLDGRNCMPFEKWQDLGWAYQALGRSLPAAIL